MVNIYKFTLQDSFNFSECMKFSQKSVGELERLWDMCKIPFGGSGGGGHLKEISGFHQEQLKVKNKTLKRLPIRTVHTAHRHAIGREDNSISTIRPPL